MAKWLITRIVFWGHGFWSSILVDVHFTIIINISVLVIIVIIAPLLHLWNGYPIQGCDDILFHLFCHNLFGLTPSINIHNVIDMQPIIIMFAYKSHHCFNSWPFLSNDPLGGWVLNRQMKTIHGSSHNGQSWPHLGMRTCLTLQILKNWCVVRMWVTLCQLCFNSKNGHALMTSLGSTM